MTPEQITQLAVKAAMAAVSAAMGEAPATPASPPDVHMADTIDNRKYFGNVDKVKCKGWKKPVQYIVAVAGRDEGITLAESPLAHCGQTELDSHGYCRYHKDQRGVPEERLREYLRERPTKTYIPMPTDRRAVEELARTMGVKVLGEQKPAANAA